MVAAPEAILALARDLRNPMTCEWDPMSRRSFRVHGIEGLSLRPDARKGSVKLPRI